MLIPSAAGVLRAISQPRLPLLEPLVYSMRVRLLDMNLGGHMDNVRYLKHMDRARNEYFLRTGLARLALTRRINLPVATSQVHYRRSLFLGQSFELHTRLLGWDEKWFFLEQRVMRQGELITRAVFKSVFLDRNGPLSPATVFETLTGGERLSSPPLAPDIP